MPKTTHHIVKMRAHSPLLDNLLLKCVFNVMYTSQSAMQDFQIELLFILKATARIQGETPLHFAASCGLLSIAQALVAAGANINEQNSDGNIPLYLSM